MRSLLFVGAILGALGAAPGTARAQQEQQGIVDRATLAVQELLSDQNRAPDAINLLRRARAVMVCPRLFRAGFIFGGEGGDCLLVARDGGGSWSSPAFYTMGSGSVGFQIGVQDAQVMMIILTERGLNAVLDSQFKIGADASVAFAHLGAGVEGSTTAAIGADIVTFARTRGLYAGVSLEGSILNYRSAENRLYYGRDVSARGLVINMEAHNPGADPLRAVLMRYAAGHGGPAAPPPAASAPPGRAAPPGRVQQEPLPTPPRR
ncbi:MAG TPA: lipid-binding SYLF domain-containing protein [Acetobacteraceae bacterium]|nr:lipid-binding SYLF domain-containing protein [Acetobacteraceae bacterium]